MLPLYCLSFIYGLSVLDKATADECPTAEFPLRNGEMRPLPFIVHVWINTVDSGERSCVGVIRKYNRILVPEWCVTIRGERRGRIAIYAPKLLSEVTSLPRPNPNDRYDKLFSLVYADDDLSRLIKGYQVDLYNSVILKIPKDISHLVPACFWRRGDLFDNHASSVTVSWRRAPNGEFILVQKLIDEALKKKKSFEDLRKGVDDTAEAVLSVTSSLEYWIFDGFFKNPPCVSQPKTMAWK
ncbi:uncharacterized protein LOC141853896 [Brevipalpus obovatus]|uniref:uncharacterized protein LOC141853896 n=1 Tax=Brevipalpus obovatus TaxID=246614 RepID=UPI003D9E8EC1